MLLLNAPPVDTITINEGILFFAICGLILAAAGIYLIKASLPERGDQRALEYKPVQNGIFLLFAGSAYLVFCIVRTVITL